MKEFNSRLLIVDDDEGILSTLHILLRRYFDEVIHAQTPEQITHLIRNQTVDLVLLDMNFSQGDSSGSDGLKWLSHILDINPDCPVILMTAFADIDLAIQALKVGAADFVVKPWDNDKLISAVMHALNQKGIDPLKKRNHPCSKVKATEEKRIFMFLDLKSSTGLAERLGHVKYFELLNDFFGDISQPVLDHYGEIYQYVGDEVVISWPMGTAYENARSIDCFFAISDKLRSRSKYFMETYGTLPEFKAGVHCGVVSVGSMGRINQMEVYSGEVLHVASRLEGLCNSYGCRLLISERMLEALPFRHEIQHHSIGSIFLRGKKCPLNLYAIDRVLQA